MISQQHDKNIQKETKQTKSNSKQKNFSLSLGHTWEISSTLGSFPAPGTTIYSKKHNMIIANHGHKTVHFYDADTLLPVSGREILELDSPVYKNCFCLENDTLMMGCRRGEIYAFNASRKILKKLRDSQGLPVFSIALIHPGYYVVSICNTGKLHLGNMESGSMETFGSRSFDSFYLHKLVKGPFLLSLSLESLLVIYRTDQLPKAPIICSINIHKVSGSPCVWKIESAMIKNKEFLITIGSDCKIRIWHLIKGRMRVLRTINIGDQASGFAYLEDHKMIAVAYGKEHSDLEFFSLISGRLESKTYLGMGMTPGNVFAMKGQNIAGVTHWDTKVIKLVKHGEEVIGKSL